ncbi:MAG: hypothetical protein KC468_22470 [Myxococcales bacterium]|nr:hypothetical protein [Myxococcales bacterium]
MLPLGRVEPTLVRGDESAALSRKAGPSQDRDLSAAVRRSVKAALARWVMRQRLPDAARAARAAVLRAVSRRWTEPRDEAFHPWDGAQHFAEDFTFVAVQRGFAVLARIEWLPGRQAQRVWLTLLGREAVYTLPGDGLLLEPCGDGARWRAGGLELDCVAPHREWRLQFRGKLLKRGLDEVGARAFAPDEALVSARVDVTFLGEAEPFIPGTDDHPELVARSLGDADWDLRLLRQLRRRRIRAYVQTGELHGVIGLDATIVAVNGASLRMHAWGDRDWGASDAAFHGFFSLQGVDASRLWVHHAEFPWVTLEGGFAEGDGAARKAVEDIGVMRERAPGSSPRHIGLNVEMAGGRLELEAAVVSAFTLEIDRRGSVRVALVAVETPDGQPAGWGLWVDQRRIDPRPRALTAQQASP